MRISRLTWLLPLFLLTVACSRGKKNRPPPVTEESGPVTSAGTPKPTLEELKAAKRPPPQVTCEQLIDDQFRAQFLAGYARSMDPLGPTCAFVKAGSTVTFKTRCPGPIDAERDKLVKGWKDSGAQGIDAGQAAYLVDMMGEKVLHVFDDDTECLITVTRPPGSAAVMAKAIAASLTPASASKATVPPPPPMAPPIRLPGSEGFGPGNDPRPVLTGEKR